MNTLRVLGSPDNRIFFSKSYLFFKSDVVKYSCNASEYISAQGQVFCFRKKQPLDVKGFASRQFEAAYFLHLDASGRIEEYTAAAVRICTVITDSCFADFKTRSYLNSA